MQEYYPNARQDDWGLQVAGQRVQIIKPDSGRGGLLEFGTELVAGADRSLVALLGASPGASTAAFIAISVLEKCFPNELRDAARRAYPPLALFKILLCSRATRCLIRAPRRRFGDRLSFRRVSWLAL